MQRHKRILPTVSRLSSELHGGVLFYEYHKEKQDRQTFKPVINTLRTGDANLRF